jgi:G3E family GTPase
MRKRRAAAAAKSSQPAVPVIVLSGFLGAGKSTLVNDLLSHPDMTDTGVVVNEFGDVSIDHDLIRIGEREMMVTTTGCLCCTAGSDIRTSLFDLHEAAQKRPDLKLSRAVVETTGLADPAPLVNQLIPGYATALGLRDHVVARRFQLAGFVCAVDATAVEQTLDTHFECLKQIAFADRIVVTKTDLLHTSDADYRSRQLGERLSQLNPAADIVDRNELPFDLVELFRPRGFATADRGADVDGWLALERVLAAESTDHPKTSPARHGGGIESFSLIHDAPIEPDNLANFLDLLKAIAGSRLLRLKGLASLSDDPARPYVIHAVQHIIHPPHALESWPSADRRTRLVLITHGLDSGVIRDLFAAVAGSKKNKRSIITIPMAALLLAAQTLLSVSSIDHSPMRASSAAHLTLPTHSPLSNS